MAVTSESGTGTGPGIGDIPKVISVDDHVIEPAHLFETWLPAKYRDRGPKPLTAGIGDLAYVGGKYRFTTDPEGQLTDWWEYEETSSRTSGSSRPSASRGTR